MSHHPLKPLLNELRRKDASMQRANIYGVIFALILFGIPAILLVLLLSGVIGNELTKEKFVLLSIFLGIFAFVFGLILKGILSNYRRASALKHGSIEVEAVLRSITKTSFSAKRRSPASHNIRTWHNKHIFHFEIQSRGQIIRFDSDMLGIPIALEEGLRNISGWVADVVYSPDDPSIYVVLLGSLRRPN